VDRGGGSHVWLEMKGVAPEYRMCAISSTRTRIARGTQSRRRGYPAGSSHPLVLRRVHVPGGSKQFGCVCSACMRERTAFEAHE
jgi:hypothetical protein